MVFLSYVVVCYVNRVIMLGEILIPLGQPQSTNILVVFLKDYFIYKDVTISKISYFMFTLPPADKDNSNIK